MPLHNLQISLYQGETFFIYWSTDLTLKKKQVGRSGKKFKKQSNSMFLSSKHLITSTWRNMANLHIDCHNDNMSQQYLESKFTWRVLHVRTPN